MSEPGLHVPRRAAVEPSPHETAILARGTRRVLYVLALIAFCVMVGLAAILTKPVLILGAVVGIGAVIAILARPYLGLLLYTAVDLLRPGELYPPLAALRLERTVAVVALGAMYFEMYRREGKLLFDRSRQTLWYMLFLGAVALSVPGSYWTFFSTNIFVDLLKLFAYYLMIVHMARTRGLVRAWVWTYMVLILYMGQSSLRSFYMGGGVFAQGIERVRGLTSMGSDPNSLATTLGSALGIFLLAGLRDRSRWGRMVSFGGVVLLTWTISLTGSRGGAIALLALLVWLWWRSRHRLITGLAGIVLIVGIYQVLPAPYQERYASIGRSELDASSEGRVEAWKKGLRMVTDRPLFGVGAGCFGFANAEAYSTANARSYLNAHNLFIQLFAETGLVGGVTFLGLLATLILTNRRAARLFRERGSAWRFEIGILDGVMAGLVFLLVASLFGHSLYRSTWYVYAGIGLALYRLAIDTPPVEGEARGSEGEGRSH